MYIRETVRPLLSSPHNITSVLSHNLVVLNLLPGECDVTNLHDEVTLGSGGVEQGQYVLMSIIIHFEWRSRR